jgi:1-phosphofructokinase family hexose kinase
MISTVTLNPALDKLFSIDEIKIGETNRTRCLASSAAGKGIDVAKVLRDLECEVSATGFLGGDVAHIFVSCLKQEKIQNYFVSIKDSTRTNIHLFDQNKKRTEFLEQGPTVTEEECDALLSQVKLLAEKSSVITICGSAPNGVSDDFFRELVQTAKNSGAIVITDTSGKLLKIALEEKPHLIKPNRSEMMALMGKSEAEDAEIIAYAQQIVKNGVPYVLVSMGGDGAMLICESGVWRGKAPDVSVKSTLGCGDTMVASLSLSLGKKASPAEMLKNAIALSSANAMTFETAHIIMNDYQNLLPVCTVEKLNV